jgi:hypothetical protein
MAFNKVRYIQFLKREQAFRNQDKLMVNEDKNSFRELLNYKIMIEDHIFFERRNEIYCLLKNFIDKKIDHNKFDRRLAEINKQTKDLMAEFRTNFEKIENFSYNSRSAGFANFFLGGIIIDCEVFEPYFEGTENLGKEWLKNCAGKAILKIQQRYI